MSIGGKVYGMKACSESTLIMDRDGDIDALSRVNDCLVRVNGDVFEGTIFDGAIEVDLDSLRLEHPDITKLLFYVY